MDLDFSQFNTGHLPAILEKARSHFELREYGKSSSFYLLLFHYDVNYCNTEKESFINVLILWLEKLISLNKLDELSTFILTSLEICGPMQIDIALVGARVLLENQYVYEAAKLLSSCRTKRITSFTLNENIEQLYNMLVDRWHYRMLNDKNRNSHYFLALKDAYKRGHRQVLDIGSGTGIFSLLSLKLGFDDIYSCEVSTVMCDIQKELIRFHGADSKICLVNKLSSDFRLDSDIQKPTLVVTEIFDCGLLGERVIPTLIDAWENLIDAELGEVIPNSAIVYGVCIECEELRKHNRYDGDNFTLYGCKDPDDVSCQPYTIEYMAGIRGGYKALSDPFIIKTLNFNKPEELREMIGQKRIIKVRITADGILDAIMVYFSLKINPSLQVDTIEKSGLCWEQAIYGILHQKDVKLGCDVTLITICNEDHFGIEIDSDNSPVNIMNYSFRNNVTEVVDTNESNLESHLTFMIDRRLVARLNDDSYIRKYKAAVLLQINILRTLYSSKKLCISFLGADISIFPMLSSLLFQVDNVEVYLIDPSTTLQEYVKQRFSSSCGIQILSRLWLNELNSCATYFDLIICEAIDCNGLMKENLVEDIGVVKRFCCTENTIFIPSKIDISAYCISSDLLLQENRVLDSNIPLYLNIAKFINEYKVVNHPDIDGNRFVNNRITEKLCLGSINLNEKLDLKILNSSQTNVDVCFTRDGMLTAILYWFDIFLEAEDVITSGVSNIPQDVKGSISTEPSIFTHWHQACLVFPEQKEVVNNEKLTLSVIRNLSNIHVYLKR